MNNRAILVTTSALALLAIFYYLNTPLTITPSAHPKNMRATNNPTPADQIPGLEVKLSQRSRDPPSLLVTLRNNDPASLTLLRWNTPLDPSAANLGVFTLVDADTHKTVPAAGLKINRMMPPSREDVVTIAPGAEETTEIVFSYPWMPTTRPAQYKVKAEGTFAAAWNVSGNALSDGDLQAYTASPFHGRGFVSNEVDMSVE